MKRVAVLGCGGRGLAHMPGLVADPRIQIIALADINEENARKIKGDYELDATIYPDIDELLAVEKPEIAVITLWTHLHLSVIQKCIDAGVKLIMCEKPMAATWEECVAIAKLAEESGTILTFCHQRRFATGNNLVRSLLDAGVFGKIERMDLFSPPHLLDCGTHSMDQAMSFNHESPVTWVHGAVDLSSTVEFFAVPAEGMFTGIFRFENGVMGTIRCGRLDLDFWGGVRVTCSDGFVEVMWDGQIRRAVLYSDPSWKFPEFEETEHEQMIGMVRNAVDALETGTEPELTYKKALRAGEALFGLYESSKRREHVVLPLAGVIGNPLFDLLAERQSYLSSTSQ